MVTDSMPVRFWPPNSGERCHGLALLGVPLARSSRLQHDLQALRKTVCFCIPVRRLSASIKLRGCTLRYAKKGKRKAMAKMAMDRLKDFE